MRGDGLKHKYNKLDQFKTKYFSEYLSCKYLTHFSALTTRPLHGLRRCWYAEEGSHSFLSRKGYEHLPLCLSYLRPCSFRSLLLSEAASPILRHQSGSHCAYYLICRGIGHQVLAKSVTFFSVSQFAQHSVYQSLCQTVYQFYSNFIGQPISPLFGQ